MEPCVPTCSAPSFVVDTTKDRVHIESAHTPAIHAVPECHTRGLAGRIVDGAQQTGIVTTLSRGRCLNVHVVT